MRVLILGYGKMGKEIEKICLERGHLISGKTNSKNYPTISDYNLTNTDVAIEFSEPSKALFNIKYCLKNKIPVISGTTGWLTKYQYIKDYCIKRDGAFLHSSNFSIGANIFFEINKKLAKLMASQNEYVATIDEKHHILKKDCPSGTAIKLALDIINHVPIYKEWSNDFNNKDSLNIKSVREGDVTGVHSVKYTSKNDSLEIKHTAHNRKEFSKGAILVAEWIIHKKGIFTMADYLKHLLQNTRKNNLIYNKK